MPPISVPSASDPADQPHPLTPSERARATREARKQARATQIAILDEHAGPTVAKAAAKHWRNPTFTTWDEALAELAAGIEVRTGCHTPDTPVYQHRLRFHPDGTVEPLDHPDLDTATLAEAAGEERDQIARVEAALSGQPPYDCLHAALVLPQRRATISPYPDPNANPLHIHRRVGLLLRSLHTLVQWAVDQQAHQGHPVNEPAADPVPEPMLDRHRGEAALRYGITPTEIRTWLHQGWGIGAAITWLQHRVPLDVADQWRQAGRTKVSDARAAAKGTALHGDPWTEAGFTAREALAWQRLKDVSIADAAECKAHGVTATLYKTWRHHRPYNYQSPTRDELLVWCKAGIPANQVLDWFTDRPHGTPCDQTGAVEAVDWFRHGFRVQEWRDIHGHPVAAADPAKYTPQAAATYRDHPDIGPAVQHISGYNYSRVVELIDLDIPPALVAARFTARTAAVPREPLFDAFDCVVRELTAEARRAGRDTRTTGVRS